MQRFKARLASLNYTRQTVSQQDSSLGPVSQGRLHTSSHCRPQPASSNWHRLRASLWNPQEDIQKCQERKTKPRFPTGLLTAPLTSALAVPGLSFALWSHHAHLFYFVCLSGISPTSHLGFEIRVSLITPGWPGTQRDRPTCLCLLRAGNFGVPSQVVLI